MEMRKGEYINYGEPHADKCSCGGEFRQVYYKNTMCDIDESIFYGARNCCCTSCSKFAYLDFTGQITIKITPKF